MKTLVCLLSDQRMQNILPLFQRGQNYGRMILIASSSQDGSINMRFAAVAADIQNALSGWIICQLYPIPVDPMNPNETRNVLRRIIAELGNPQELVINFTGGTKPMSIGAYQAGLEACAPMIYVDTETHQIYFHNGMDVSAHKFDLDRLSVSLVLNAHGYVVDPVQSEQKAFSSAELDLAEFTVSRRPQSIVTWLALRTCLINQQNSNIRRHIDRGKIPRDPLSDVLISIFVDHGLIYDEDDGLTVTEEGFKIIEGGWLEGYVFMALKNSRLFMDVSQPLVIKKGAVKNELDVCCTLAGKLAIIECKSGKTYKEKTKAVNGSKRRRVVTDASQFLNRLTALKDTIGGTFGKPFLVLVDQKMGSGTLNRAMEYTSRIIYANDLAKVEIIVYDEMMKKGR